MSKNLIVQAAPHIHSSENTSRIMALVLISLVPASIASIWLFGLRALLLILCCVAGCVGFEYLACRIMKRPNPIGDLSAAVTGLLLALNLPVTMPIPLALVGCFFAIVIVKQLFGGIGQNFANPAITARVMLLASFAGPMTNWVMPRQLAMDAVSSATPLGLLDQGAEVLPSYWELFIGLHSGSMGETCIAALLLGGIFLLITKVIHPVIPLTYLGSVAVFSLLLGQDPLFQLMSGGVVLGAFFMATDYSTCPLTSSGRFVFALGCGLLTVAIRSFGNYPEGVSFSILLMNLFTPLIDRCFVTRPFGGLVAKAKKGGASK
ncbi:MAG: RnfABCDGE type electron transport complex subunit D [Bacillota bacterium]|nr:RnfABCDGE type electron transport complex subunit D [Bacillota bacterium]